MQGWLRDMNAHQIEYSETVFDALDKSVQEELDNYDPAEVEVQRDQLMIHLLKDKIGASAIV